MSIVGLADDEAGEERAQGQGQPDGLGERRGAERDGQGHEQEELLVVRARDPRHQRRDALGDEERERREDHQGLAEGEADREEAAGLEGAEGGDQHDQDHDAEVLDEADAHHHPPVAGVQLAPVEEQPRQHHGARHRGDEPDDHALQGWPAEHEGGAEAKPRARDHPQRAPEERHRADAEEVPHRELDAHREHEEHHTDLREEVERSRVGDRHTRRQRADEEPAEDVAQDEGLVRPPCEGSAADGGREDEREISEDDGIAHCRTVE